MSSSRRTRAAGYLLRPLSTVFFRSPCVVRLRAASCSVLCRRPGRFQMFSSGQTGQTDVVIDCQNQIRRPVAPSDCITRTSYFDVCAPASRNVTQTRRIQSPTSGHYYLEAGGGTTVVDGRYNCLKFIIFDRHRRIADASERRAGVAMGRSLLSGTAPRAVKPANAVARAAPSLRSLLRLRSLRITSRRVAPRNAVPRRCAIKMI